MVGSSLYPVCFLGGVSHCPKAWLVASSLFSFVFYVAVSFHMCRSFTTIGTVFFPTFGFHNIIFQSLCTLTKRTNTEMKVELKSANTRRSTASEKKGVSEKFATDKSTLYFLNSSFCVNIQVARSLGSQHGQAELDNQANSDRAEPDKFIDRPFVGPRLTELHADEVKNKGN